MKLALALLFSLAIAAPAGASQELTHTWKAMKLTVATGAKLFGDVDVTAGADASGSVKTIDVTFKGKTITIPAKWIESLPKLPLASIEIRTEPGYDPDPWLYVFFRSGAKNAKDTVEVHFAFQAGKLKDASVDTYDGKGGSKHETKKVP